MSDSHERITGYLASRDRAETAGATLSTRPPDHAAQD